MKKLLVFVMLVGGYLTASAQVPSVVAITSDGNEYEYRLASVEEILFETNRGSSSMTLVGKDGIQMGGFQTLLFGTMADVPTSIDESGETKVYAYPNPVVNTLNVLGVSETEPLFVYDLSGKCLMTETGNKVEVSNLTNGTYILKVNNQCIKFIKK
jgi:hypothetical protein